MELVNLSPESRALAETMGLAGFLVLVEHYGGTPLRVHTRPNPNSPLARAIGADAYRRLIFGYHGEEITVPKLTAVKLAQRNAEIRRAYAEGVTANQLARRHNLHTRTIRSIVARGKAVSSEA